MKKLLIIASLVFILVSLLGCSINNPNIGISYTRDFDRSKLYVFYKENRYLEAEKLVTEYLEKNPNDILALLKMPIF